MFELYIEDEERLVWPWKPVHPEEMWEHAIMFAKAWYRQKHGKYKWDDEFLPKLNARLWFGSVNVSWEDGDFVLVQCKEME